jgi:hypothetical protein
VHAACVIDKECSAATIHDTHFQDYYTMQLILEQTLGGKIARIQPLYPYGGMTATGVLKKYATGVKSMLLSPTKHNIQLVGYIIYEYTVEKTKSGDAASPAVKEGYEKDRSSPNIITNDKLEWDLGEIFKEQLEDFENNNDEQKVVAAGFKYKQPEKSKMQRPDGYLSYLYPLVDIVVTGPFTEDNGQASLTLTRKDGNNMRVIKRDEDSGTLTYSLTVMPTHSLTHSLTYSLTHLLTHSITHLLTHLLTHSLTYSFTHLLTHSLTHSRMQGG